MVRTTGLRDFVEQVDEPLAALAAEEAVLVLDIEQISRMAVDESGDLFIGEAVLFLEARDHFGWIAARFSAGLVDRDHVGACGERAVERTFHVVHERGDPTFSRRIRTQ